MGLFLDVIYARKQTKCQHLRQSEEAKASFITSVTTSGEISEIVVQGYCIQATYFSGN